MEYVCFVWISRKTENVAFHNITFTFYNRGGMFTARYAQSPYITQIRFVFKRLITTVNHTFCTYNISFKYLELIPFNVEKNGKDCVECM
jgi:hypothetical protein